MRYSQASVRQPVHRGEQQDPEHQHVIEGGSAALRAVGARHGLLQLGAEHREIHQRADPLEVIARGRQLPQPLIRAEEPRLPTHRHPPRQSTSVNLTLVSITKGVVEMSSFTPRRPRLTKLLGKVAEKVSTSDGRICRPTICRRPSGSQATAMIAATEAPRPPSRWRRQVASRQRYGRSPDSGRSRKAMAC